jgi:hypothetical protein
MSPLGGASEDGVVETVGEAIKSALESYQRSPVLRMLVKLYPPLAVAEAGILGTYSWFQNRRVGLFAEEFTTLGIAFTAEDAKRREFFDAYTATATHVMQESRDEKIKLFARLFGQFVKGGCTAPIDRYEEYLQLLDEISEREFELLLLLHRYEVKNEQIISENRLQQAMNYWPNFTAEARDRFQIDEGTLEAMLVRLTRTGMYKEITGTFLGYGGGIGYLTALFVEFKSALGIGPIPQGN